MTDFHAIYKYLVKFSFIIVTAIFIGWTVHFVLQNVFLGKDAYIWRDTNCEYQYGFGEGYQNFKTMPVAEGQKPLSEEDRKVGYEQCKKERDERMLLEYKKGLLGDVSGIVSMFFVSIFLFWADRMSSKE